MAMPQATNPDYAAASKEAYAGARAVAPFSPAWRKLTRLGEICGSLSQE